MLSQILISQILTSWMLTAQILTYRSRLISALVLRERMATLSNQNLVAVCQMTSTSNKDANLQTVRRLVKETSALGAKVSSILFYLIV